MASADDAAVRTVPVWLQNVAVSVLSWLSIGMLGGAGFLSFVIPNRLSQIDSNQQAILIRMTALERQHSEMSDTLQKLSDRLIRLESQP